MKQLSLFIGVMLLALTLSAPASAGTTDVYPTGGNGAWWIYRWGDSFGLVTKAKRDIKKVLDCEGQGNCQAIANETYRAHYNVRTGPGPHTAHAFVDCTAANAPVPNGHILILSCSSANIAWNICPIHINQNK